MHIRRSSRSPTRRAVLGAADGRASSHLNSPSRYQPPPASVLTRPSESVLPGGVATRRPSAPSTPSPATLLKGGGYSLVGGAVMVSLVNWLPRAPHYSDFQYGGYGILAGSGAYVSFKALRRTRPGIAGVTMLSAVGALAGITFNTFRLENLMQDWSEERDEKSGDKFYHNFRTGQSQWDRPAGF